MLLTVAGEPMEVDYALHDRTDLMRAGATEPVRSNRAGGAGEIEEVRALGVVELERVSERVERAVRDAGGVAALQALVVLDAHAGRSSMEGGLTSGDGHRR
jgi:hypothetical protein